MPYIETEVDIDPCEFLESCSKKELKKTVDWIVDEMETDSDLREHFYKVSKESSNIQFEGQPETTGEAEFMEKLESLKKSYYRMEVSDHDLVEKLFTKYVWY